MTVLIKGFDMPKVCSECCLFHEGYCSVSADEWGCGVDVFNAKAEWCPLVEVPTPHGRLIDHKKLEKDLGKRWETNDDQDFCNKEVWHALEEAPTVIEAEGE